MHRPCLLHISQVPKCLNLPNLLSTPNSYDVLLEGVWRKNFDLGDRHLPKATVASYTKLIKFSLCLAHTGDIWEPHGSGGTLHCADEITYAIILPTIGCTTGGLG